MAASNPSTILLSYSSSWNRSPCTGAFTRCPVVLAFAFASLHTDRDFASCEVAASIAVILLAAAGDVDRLGLVVLLDHWPKLGGDWQRHRTKECNTDSERRKQASHGEPSERKITFSDYTEGSERTGISGLFRENSAGKLGL